MPLDQPAEPHDPESYRMTLGEHLEELRRVLIRAMIALLVAAVLCIWPAKYLLEIIARPVVLALRRNGQPDNLLATSPVELVLIYVKVVLVAGFILAAPYILYQLWSFVAAGLYPHERKWVTGLVPWSVGLFLGGVVFMYVFVLLVSLNFLVGFATWIPLPRAEPNAFERMVLHDTAAPPPQTQPFLDPLPVTLRSDDPAAPPQGAVWFNVPEQKLKLQGTDGVYSLRLTRDDLRGMVTTHFRLSEYLSFVLVMTIAFGLAFQMPLVVLFLARSGIVPTETFRKYRKLTILGIVVVAGILAPPDLLSHLLLSGPMVLLFEIGLLVATRAERRAASARQGDR